MSKKQLISINQACSKYNISRQMISVCIKSKRLNAEKIKGKWFFTEEDWQEYAKSRYDRTLSVRNGKKMYDPKNGIISPGMLAKMYQVSKQRIYYMIRKGILPCKRIGAAYIIKQEDVIDKIPIMLHEKNKRYPTLDRI